MRNLEVAVSGGHLVGDAVVLVLAEELVVLDAATGEERVRGKHDGAPLRFAAATNRGLVFVAADQVRILDVARARVTTLLDPKEAIASMHVVTPDERPIVWVHHGARLSAYDVMRRQFTGRVELGPLTKVARAKDHIVALEEAGVVWILDGTRALGAK